MNASRKVAWGRAMAALAATPTGGIVLYDGQPISAYSLGKKKGTHVMVAVGMPGWFSMKCVTGTYGPFNGAKTTLLDEAFDAKYGSNPEYERVEGKRARNYRKKGTSGRGTTINVNSYLPVSLFAAERPGTPKRSAPSSDGGAAKKTHLASSAEQPKSDVSDADVAAFDVGVGELPSNLDDVFGPPTDAAETSAGASAETDDALAELFGDEKASATDDPLDRLFGNEHASASMLNDFDQLIAAIDDGAATAMMGQVQ